MTHPRASVPKRPGVCASNIVIGFHRPLQSGTVSVRRNVWLNSSFDFRKRSRVSRVDTRRDESDLEFPIEPDFVSHPPQINPQSMLRRIAGTMPWRSTRPGAEESQLAGKIPVEFVL